MSDDYTSVFIRCAKVSELAYLRYHDLTKAEIFPSETDEFYYKIVDGQISFNRNTDGVIEGLTLHQGGQNIPKK